jgi:hypothetical protein
LKTRHHFDRCQHWLLLNCLIASLSQFWSHPYLMMLLDCLMKLSNLKQQSQLHLNCLRYR